MKLRFTFLLFFTLHLFNVFSQEFSGFSGNTGTFHQEVAIFFDADARTGQEKREATKFHENFTLFWTSGQVSETEKKEVVELSTLMYSKKLRPFPQFAEYFNSIYTFCNTNQKVDFFKPWHITLTFILNNQRVQHFISFLEFSNDFFENQYLYNSKTRTWKAESKNYKFYYDEEPIIEFPSLTLKYYSNNDSSVIHNTSGIFYPLKNLWLGKYGKIDWQRADFAPNTLYAEFDSYQIDTRSPDYSIDRVRLYYPELFGSQILPGILREKVLANRSGEDAIYPEFVSTDARFRINNIFKDIDYEGGFTIRGARLIGSGDEIDDAYIYVHREGKLFMKFASKSYSIRKNSIISQNASVTIYLDNDSIFHPQRIFNYANDKRQISLLRERHGLSRAPFYNSYHKLEMDFEALYWKMDEPMIEFAMMIGPGSEGRADFVSADYFSMFEFQKVMGIDDVHPLTSLKNYSKKINSTAFSVTGFANYRRIQVEIIRNLIVNLAVDGYIFFDADNDMIYLKDKTFNYLSAAAGKKDYDVIQFNSTITAQSNATLSLLENYNLKMCGVSRVFLSDSQKVYVYPKEQEITVKKNRDFTFSGRVQVGLFEYYGSNFLFEYDRFKIDMPLIDSMAIKVRSRTLDEYGFRPLVKVKNVVEDMRGDLLIDHPNNKSGIKHYPHYPLFNSKQFSYVYYDKTSIFKGKYPIETFFYRLDPFSLDSMNQLTTDNIFFEGYLESAGIFPEIREPIRVQKDYSLGFTKKSPPEGYPIYEGKATFINDINLSNQGLRGDGIIEFLTSTSKSNDFIFFPDIVVSAQVASFNIEERKADTEYPLVAGEDLKMEWLPYADSMIVSAKHKNKPFKMFTEEADFHGTLRLTPNLLSGNGMINHINAEITSNNFKFINRVVDADTCDFLLKRHDLNELALTTSGYVGHIDFDARTGEFISHSGNSIIRFPINQYICYMDRFEWLMDQDEIALSSSSEKQQEGLDTMDLRELVEIDIFDSEFISTHPSQDSLSFVAARAQFNIKKSIINAESVRAIRVADAAVMPADGKVTILKEAEIVPLEDAQILANTTTKYHFFNNSKVNIYGRNSYKADGYYEYIDELGDIQEVFFEIKVDTSLQTVGVAKFTDTTEFTISPFFDFQGEILLSANNELLNFKGGARISHQCDTLTRQWMKFQAEIDPMNVMLPVEKKLKNIEDNGIQAGLYFSGGDTGVYSAFVAPKIKRTDNEIASSHGFIVYDKITNEYRISSKEKLAQTALPGKYLSLDVNRCIIRAEGKLSLGANLGRIDMAFYGNAVYFSEIDSTFMNANIDLDFFFNNNSLEIIKKSVQTNTSLDGVHLSGELYTKYLGEVLGIEEADRIISELSLYGQVRRLPEALEHTITLLNVNLIYNPKTQSYISEGKIGIGIMGNTQINKYVDGIIEIELRGRGDRLTFYLEPSPSEWFYFNYANNLMQAFSSIKEFNENIIATPDKDRQIEAKDKERPYSYYVSNEGRKNAFLKKMEDAFKKTDTPEVDIDDDTDTDTD